MFRTQNNLPEIYVNTSRDFQLLCRLKDAVFGATKYSIDSLQSASNTLEIPSALLPLLKSKVGFFSAETLDDDQLRILLSVFPYIIKYKGSKQAIKQSIFAWLRMNRFHGRLVDIPIDNSNYTITINLDQAKTDTTILDTLLQYAIPTGYIIKYQFIEDSKLEDQLKLDDSLTVDIVNTADAGQTQLSTDMIAKPLIGTVGLTQITNASDLHLATNPNE